MVYEGIAAALLMAGMVFAFIRSNEKTRKEKLRVWGKTTMLIIAPFFSWQVGRLYAISEVSGFAMVGVLMIMFPDSICNRVCSLLEMRLTKKLKKHRRFGTHKVPGRFCICFGFDFKKQ